MKKSIGLLLGILVAFSAAFAGESKDVKKEFIIDTKASKVFWNGKKVTGEHTGYLSVQSGTVSLNDKMVTDAVVNMDMNSIVCTDLEAGEWNDKLVGHLKSEDFFSVEKHANANFNITSVKAGNKAGAYEVKGDLTIKGITHEIVFPATIEVADGMVKATGTAKLDRTKWDIKYGSGKFFAGLGDKMIYDEFEVTFDILAKSNTESTTLR